MKKKKNSTWSIVLLIAILIILAYLIYYYISSTQQIITDNYDISVSPTPTQTVAFIEEEVSLVNNPDTASVKLTNVSSQDGSGTGYMLIDESGLHHLVIANLPDPENNSFYEGWLLNETTGDFFSTGKMIKQPDGTYKLDYSAPEDFPGFNGVVITLEAVQDVNPEAHILEGAIIRK